MTHDNGTKKQGDAVEYTVVSPDDSQRVIVEEGGRISIPSFIYERIGASPGGRVKIRKEGTALVIERLED